MYTELLRLCGFEPEEIERERPRIDRAFEILEIGAEDIDRAEKRVTEYFDIKLVGIRKSLGIWMKELIDLVLAKEEGKKVIYTQFPTVSQVNALGALAFNDVYISAPEMVLCLALGSIFGKITPIQEVAEEHGLPPGLANCSLLQARLGAIVKGIIPVPDLMITSGFFCDQSSKLDELLNYRYGIPAVYMDGCMDQNWDEFPGISSRRVEYVGSGIRKALEKFEEVTGHELTDELLHEARRANGKLRFAFQELQELMRSDPVPLSHIDLSLMWWFTICVPGWAAKEGMQAINTTLREVKQRVDEGIGVVEKGAPRVLWGMPPTTEPGILRMVEGFGLALPLGCATWLTPRERVKGQYTSFAEGVAESMQRTGGLYAGASAVISHLKELCQLWNVDGMIWFYLFSCRPYAIPPLMIKKAIEDELGIPVLALEGDCYDTRDYSVQQLRTRVETFAAMLRAAKAG